MLEVGGLPEPEAADIDQPLLAALEDATAASSRGGFTTVERTYDLAGDPADELRVDSRQPHGDPLVVVLATRNQAVEDAAAVVERLNRRP